MRSKTSQAIRIWPLNLLAMASQTGLSERFFYEDREIEERKDIMERNLPLPQERVVHYYGSEEEVEEDHIEDGFLPNIESPSAAPKNSSDISQFLKLPKGSKKPARMGRIDPL